MAKKKKNTTKRQTGRKNPSTGPLDIKPKSISMPLTAGEFVQFIRDAETSMSSRSRKGRDAMDLDKIFLRLDIIKDSMQECGMFDESSKAQTKKFESPLCAEDMFMFLQDLERMLDGRRVRGRHSNLQTRLFNTIDSIVYVMRSEGFGGVSVSTR
jgi:hypothetical protein